MNTSAPKAAILVFSQSPLNRFVIAEICRKFGVVHLSSTPESTLDILNRKNIQTLVIDQSLADYAFFRNHISSFISIVIIGKEMSVAEERVKEWPLDHFVTSNLVPSTATEKNAFRRTISLALQYTTMKRLIRTDQEFAAPEKNDVSSLYSEIKDIKHFIQKNVLTELEKRISFQTKYIQFKDEKQKIEHILKKLHTANDVTRLLDIILNVKNIIGSEGISIYLIEKNDSKAVFLKPLVWNNTILSHPEYSKNMVSLDAQDLSAEVARSGRGIHVSQSALKKILIARHIDRLDYPLKSILSMPLMLEKKVIGVIETYNKKENASPASGDFTSDDQRLMQLLSEHIAIAITNLNLIQFDALTGMLRPDPFFEAVIQKLRMEKKRRHEDSAYAFVMGDVDWFKNYNDRNGHEAGNRLLQELSRILKSSIREEDLLCRYGGEEFLFFLSKIKDIEEACHLTERIRKSVEEHYFEAQEFQPKKNLTMSFGLTVFSRDSLGSFEAITTQILKRHVIEADMALSEAKSKKTAVSDFSKTVSGTVDKNRVTAFNPDLLPKIKNLMPHQKKIAMEKRKYPRYFTSAMLLYKNDHNREVTRTINLSLSGAKIPTDIPLKLFETIDVILVLGETACQVKGDIVYSKPINTGESKYHSGLRFRDVSSEERDKIKKYLSSLLDQPSSKIQ